MINWAHTFCTWLRYTVLAVALLGLLPATFAVQTTGSLGADIAQGTVRAEGVIGKVYLINAGTHKKIPVVHGMEFPAGYAVQTGVGSAGGQVTLKFSNGVRLQLFSGALLNISAFAQESVATLATPQPRSWLSIHLMRGELLGFAEKRSPGSIFHVHTPKALGDITGTIFGLRHEENATLSEISVYEGSVEVITKIPLSDSQIRSLSNWEEDISPFEAVLSAGQSLTLSGNPQSTTLLLTNISYSEFGNFQSELNGFAQDLGISRSALREAVVTALGTTTNPTPTRTTQIQNTRIQTSTGPGTQTNVIVTDDNGYSSEERTVTVEYTDPSSGAVETSSQRVNLTATVDPSTLDIYLTQRTGTRTEIENPDGSFTSTESITTLTSTNPDSTAGITTTDSGLTQNLTYTATTTGDAAGNITRTATSTYTDASGTRTFEETKNIAINATTGSPVVTTTRTLTDTDGSQTITTFNSADPVSTATIASVQSPSPGILTYTGTESLPTETTTRTTDTTVTFTFTNGEGLVKTVFLDTQGDTDYTETVTVDAGDGTTHTVTNTVSVAQSEAVRSAFVIGGSGPESTTITLNTTQTENEFTRLENGGSRQTIETTGTDSIGQTTTVQETTTRTVFDNGNVSITTSIRVLDDTGAETQSSSQTVTTSLNADGSRTQTILITNTGGTSTTYTRTVGGDFDPLEDVIADDNGEDGDAGSGDVDDAIDDQPAVSL